MKTMKFFAFPLFALILVAFAVSSANGIGAYTQLPTIITPGSPGNPLPVNGSFDISWYDPGRDRFYFTDRLRGGGALEVIDARTNTFLYAIGGFFGFASSSSRAGPDG